jgi:hypothetical protein
MRYPLGLLPTLECGLVMADPAKSGGGFSRLGVGTNQPLTPFKIWLLGILGHFPIATWKPMTGPYGDLSLSHVTSAMSNTECVTSLTIHVGPCYARELLLFSLRNML